MNYNNILRKIKSVFNIKSKVVVSLTTIPTRLVSEYPYDMRYCLDSLLKQSYEDYEVHLNIPHVYKKTNEEYIIPDWLKELEAKDKKLKIFRTDDYGAITKSFPTILRENNPETIIIVVDDDLVYHKELVAEHIKNQDKWPNNPVGYDGMRSRNPDGSPGNYFGNMRDYYYSANSRDSFVDILQHYKSVSYKRRFFESDFETFTHENYHWNDDLIMAAYFAYKKVDRICTFYPKDMVCTNDEDWNNFVGRSFPLVAHTQHRSDEGCTVERAAGNNRNEDKIYKFIDSCYIK